MNWDRIEGNWKQLTGHVKEQWAKLTDDDYQDQMADAVLKGIKKYFAKNPPLAKNRLT